MIIELKRGVSRVLAEAISLKYAAVILNNYNGRLIIVTSGKLKENELDESVRQLAERVVITGSDIQLASRKFLTSKREIRITDDLTIGGNSQNTLVITGPCSVESEKQIRACAELCVQLGIKVLRAGAYKPRTSPYSFQGLEIKGLQLLDKIRSDYGLKIITEVKDGSHAEAVIEYADIIQIGAKAMYDHSILRACGKARKPVLLKRGFGSNLQEFVQAAEFILCGGNEQVILCERGIRTFENFTRFTLDLCGVSWLKENVNLPIVIDPSHAMGFAYGVPDLSRAAVAMGIDGLLIETHPNPAAALSDPAQQLTFDQFKELYGTLADVAKAIGYKIV
ncbi:MAG: 3-deoxy-7-phosphoheptulonate synthase [Chitinophagales bacterium]|nr:3-deoxy-7-phosphoheptulonate synthase [Chitinophagales bacterium]